MRLTDGKATTKKLAQRMDVESSEITPALKRLRTKGLVERDSDGARLTVKGRRRIRVVFIGGGFEVIHPGHLYTVSEAKKLGDVLVVVAARDSTIRRHKGREPISSEEERLALLASLRPVDAAILGVEGDIYETLERVRPDIVALGYDQYHAEEEILNEGRRRGMKLEVVRLGALRSRVKTSKLLEALS